MIEKTLKTTTGKLLVKLPTELKEVTLGQLMEMQAKPVLNDLDAIGILSGIPVTELQNVIDFRDFEGFSETVISLSYQIKHLYNSDAVPVNIFFNIGGKNKTINVIRNLSIEPAGAFMAARDIIAEEINEHIKQHGEEDWQELFNPSLKASCQVLAHYFYCRTTGEKYDEYKIEEFTEIIKKMRVTEALPIAKYFFELSKLIETENKLLGAASSVLEKKAGIQSFEKFKYINTVNALAGGDITKWSVILNTPYDRVLTKLLLNKTEADYQRKYADLLQAQR